MRIRNKGTVKVFCSGTVILPGHTVPIPDHHFHGWLSGSSHNQKVANEMLEVVKPVRRESAKPRPKPVETDFVPIDGTTRPGRIQMAVASLMDLYDGSGVRYTKAGKPRVDAVQSLTGLDDVTREEVEASHEQWEAESEVV